MKNQEIKKIWVTPSVQVLNIKKDTFSGSGTSTEKNEFKAPSVKKDSTRVR